MGDIIVEIITAIGDFDYDEDGGENEGKGRNEVPVPPISPLTPNHHANPIDTILTQSSAHIHPQQLQLYHPT